MCHFVIPQLDVFEAAELYQKEGIPVIILAGKKYGLGSSRDWAAKGPFLLVLLVCLSLGVVVFFWKYLKTHSLISLLESSWERITSQDGSEFPHYVIYCLGYQTSSHIRLTSVLHGVFSISLLETNFN